MIPFRSLAAFVFSRGNQKRKARQRYRQQQILSLQRSFPTTTEHLEERLVLTNVSLSQPLLNSFTVTFDTSTTQSGSSLWIDTEVDNGSEFLAWYTVFPDGTRSVSNFDFDTTEAGLQSLPSPLTQSLVITNPAFTGNPSNSQGQSLSDANVTLNLGTIKSFGHDLNVQWKSPIVLDSTRISTRDVSPGADPFVADSIGNSGDFKLEGDTDITVQQAQILTDTAPDSSTHTPGSLIVMISDVASLTDAGSDSVSISITESTLSGGTVEISATNTLRKFRRQVVGVDSNTATVTIDHSIINGTNTKSSIENLNDVVTIKADAEDAIGFKNGEFKYFGTTASGLFTSSLGVPGLGQWPTFSVMDRDAEATLSLSESTITSAGSIALSSQAITHSEIETTTGKAIAPTQGINFAAGYSRAKSRSTTSLSGASTVIHANQSIKISSTGTASAKATSRVASSANKIEGELDAPPLAKQGAVAVTDSHLNVQTTVDSGVQITSDQGSVTVVSTGTPQSIPVAETKNYGNGTTALSIAISLDESNIATTMDGTISAVNGSTQDRSRPIPLDSDGVSGDILTIPSIEPAWKFGDQLNYQIFNTDGTLPPGPGKDGAPPQLIDGLDNTDNYFLIDSNPDPGDPSNIQIRLANTLGLDLDLPSAVDRDLSDEMPTQSFDVIDVKTFSPTHDLDLLTGKLTIPGHGFQTGDRIQYLAIASDSQENQAFEPIGSLRDQTDYYVIRLDADTFQLSASAADAAGQNPIIPTDTGKGDQHGFAFTVSQIFFDPYSDLDPETNRIAIDTSGIETGTRLIYQTDPTLAVTQSASKLHAFTSETRSIPFDASSNIVEDIEILDLVGNVFTKANHGWSTGTELTYLTSDSPLQTTDGVSLTAGQSLYVIHVDPYHFQVAASADDAAVARFLEFQIPDSSHHTFKSADSKQWTFDPTSSVTLPAVDPDQNILLFPEPHQFVTGQRVRYEAEADSSAIGGLTSGVDYFAIVTGPNSFALAKSSEDAFSDIPTSLSAPAAGSVSNHRFESSQVDVESDWIILPSHGLEIGQRVDYDAAGSASVGGLLSGIRYHAAPVTPHIIRLATSVADASLAASTAGTSGTVDLTNTGSGSAQTLESTTITHPIDAARTTSVVDLVGNTIELPHAWKTGQRVGYQTFGGNPIGGLADAQDYYVINRGNNRISLTNSREDALAEQNAIDLTSMGTLGNGPHGFSILPDSDVLGQDSALEGFYPTLGPVVDPSSSTLEVPDHSFSTGQQVRYLSGDGDPIGGLQNGFDYFLIVVDKDHIRFASDENGAKSGAFIALTQAATGSGHSLEFETSFTIGDQPINGLQNGGTYYAVVDGPTTLRLADNDQEADLAAPIQFSLNPSSVGDPPEYYVRLSSESLPAVAIQTTTSSAKNQATAGAGIGGSPNLSDLIMKPNVLTNNRLFGSGNANSTLKKTLGISPAPTTSEPKGAGFSASLALVKADHTFSVLVNGSIITGGNLTIESTHKQNSRVIAKGTMNASQSKKFGMAVGSATLDVKNHLTVDIGAQAKLDAGADMRIQSNLAYPRLKYPTVKDGVATSGKTKRNNPANWPPNIAKWISPTLGIDSWLNVWTNSVTAGPNSVDTAITGSFAELFYDNVSTAIVHNGAQLNQRTDQVSNDEQSIAVDAKTTMTLIGVAGNFKMNFLKGVGKNIQNRSFDLGKVFSPFGTKSKSASLGGSVLYVSTNSSTLALIGSNALVRTSSSQGLNVQSTEQIYTNLFAESGGESDGVGIGVSGVVNDHRSTTVTSVSPGTEVKGGNLTLASSNDLRHIVASGSMVSSGDVGIGLSGNAVLVDRQTGSFLGLIPGTMTSRFPDSVSADLQNSDGNSRTIETTGLSLKSTNKGDVYSFAVVAATPTTRSPKNPAAQGGSGGDAGKDIGKDAAGENLEGEQNRFDVSIAGDAVVNKTADEALSGIDVSGFSAISATNGSNASISVVAENLTHYAAFAGAAAIASSNGGGSVAVSGSVAWNRIDRTTKASITDSSNSTTLIPLMADSSITVSATSGDVFSLDDSADASVWAVAASLGIASSKGLSATGAFTVAVNDIHEETEAEVDHVHLRTGLPAAFTTGTVTIEATNQHKITGDGGAFAVSFNKSIEDEEPGGSSLGFGGTYTYNNLTVNTDANISETSSANTGTLSVAALDKSEITNYALAGAVSAGESAVSLAATFAGATNLITRRIRSRIGRDEESTENIPGSGLIAVHDSVSVTSSNNTVVHGFSGGIAFDLSLKPDGDFSGALGAAWTSNTITDDSETSSTIKGVEFDGNPSLSPDLRVVAQSEGEIRAWSVQLGALASDSQGLSLNVAGAIALGSLGGTVDAVVENSEIPNAGLVDIHATTNDFLRSETMDLSLSVSTTSVSVGVGIAFAQNNSSASTRAEIVASNIVSDANISVIAEQSKSVAAHVVNSSAQLGFTDDGLSVSVNYIGLWAENTINDQTTARISGGMTSAAGKVDVTAMDNTDIVADGTGTQVQFTLSDGLAVSVGVLTQISRNTISSDVQAIADAASSGYIPGMAQIDSNSDISVLATKFQDVQTRMITASLGFVIAADASVAASGASTTVDSRINESSTISQISNANLSGSSVTVHAESTPQISTWVETVDIEVSLSAGFAAAAAVGVSTATNLLEETVLATVEKGSTIHATSGAFSLEAHLNRPDSDSNLKLRGETVGVAIAFGAGDGLPISFAGSGVGSNLKTTSQSVVNAILADSAVNAQTNISVVAQDESKSENSTEDFSFSAGVISAAASVPLSTTIHNNDVLAAIQTTDAGASPPGGSTTVQSQSGNIDVKAISTSSATTSTVVWTGELGLGISTDVVHSTSILSSTVKATLTADSSNHVLEVLAPDGTIRVDSFSDDHGYVDVYSGNISIGVASIDVIELDSSNSADVFAGIEGNINVSGQEIKLNAVAEGSANAKSKQRDFSLGFPIGVLKQTITAAPTVTVLIGEDSSLDDDNPVWTTVPETTVKAVTDLLVVAKGVTDATAESRMLGGGLGITVLSPSVTSTVSPTVRGAIGQMATLLVGRLASFEINAGVDKNPHPGNFDGGSGVDPVLDQITFTESQSYTTGDLLQYENYPDDGETTSSLVSPIPGLQIGKQYRIIDKDEKVVQLGEQLTSSVNSIDTVLDHLIFVNPVTFEGPFEDWAPEKWDRVSYQHEGGEPISGLSEPEDDDPMAESYWVQRLNNNTIKLYPYMQNPDGSPDYPVSPKLLTTNTVNGNEFNITAHGFETGDAVTYEASPSTVFSVDNVNQTTSQQTYNENGQTEIETELTPEDSSPSNSIYVGDEFARYSNDQYVQYNVDATSDQWFWVTGNTADPKSDPILGEQFWTGTVSGDPYVDPTTSEEIYHNWKAGGPDNSTSSNGEESALIMLPDGTWDDVSPQRQYSRYILEQPQFVLLKDHGRVEHYQAHEIAKQAGGWLPSISTQTEFDAAKTAAAGHEVWLGGSDNKNEDTWVWDTDSQDPSNGENFWTGGSDGDVPNDTDFVNWSDGEPNDKGRRTKHRNDETQLEMYSSGDWNDVKGSDHNYVLMEQPRFRLVTMGIAGDFETARAHAVSQGGWMARVPDAATNAEIQVLLNSNDAWIGGARKQAIDGLENGGRYFISLIQNNADHLDSIQLRHVNSDGTPGEIVSLGTAGKVDTITHRLTPVSELPIESTTNSSNSTPLVSGQTFYAITVDSDRLKLARTKDDAVNNVAMNLINAINGPGNATTKVGDKGSLRSAGADLESIGSGTHSFVYDITGTSVGTHSLQFVKKGSSPQLDATGTAKISAKTNGGALLAATGDPKAYATALDVAAFTVAGDARIHAESIDIISKAAANAESEATSHTGGLASDSKTHARSVVESTSIVTIEGSLRAAGGISIEASNSDNAHSHAETKGGGFVSTQTSDAEIHQTYQTLVDLQPGAHLLAGEDVSITSGTAFEAFMTSETLSDGVFGDSKANQADGSGIRMVDDTDTRNSNRISLTDAVILADRITLISALTQIETPSAIAHASGGGIQNKQRASGTFEVQADVDISILGHSQLAGREVTIHATAGGASKFFEVDVTGQTKRGRAASRANASVDYDAAVSIHGDGPAVILSDNVNIKATQTFDQSTQLNPEAIVKKGDNTSIEKTVIGDRTIAWNSTVLGRATAKLDIDENGLITEARGVTVSGGQLTEGSTVPAGQSIDVTSVPFDFIEQLTTFEASSTDASIGGIEKVSGDALFYAEHHADFENHSNRDMRLPGIDLTAPIEDVMSTKTFWVGKGDGTVIDQSYTNWNTNEPNDYGAGEDHVEMYSNGKWNDLNKTAMRFYVLETAKGFQLINDMLRDYDTATADAINRGGQIASVSTQAENDLIREIAQGNHVWLNATDEVEEGTWTRPQKPSVVLVDSGSNSLNVRRSLQPGDSVLGRVVIKTLQDINETDPGDTILAGSITNPSGMVEITNIGGSIDTSDSNTERQVIGHSILLEAPQGDVGGTLNVILDSQDAWAETMRSQNPDGFWRLSELLGTTASETTASAPAGTYINAKLGHEGAISNEPENRSVSFAGKTDAYVSIPDSNALYGANGQTVTGWFYIESFDKDWQTIYWKGDTPDCTDGCANRENSLWIYKTGLMHLAAAPTGSTGQSSISSPAGEVLAGQWNHFATILDPQQDTMRVYLNGEKLTEDSFPATTLQDTSGDWYLGNNPTWNSQLNGALDDFAIFNRILSDNEIQRQSDAGSARARRAPILDAVAGGSLAIDITAEPDSGGEVRNIRRLSGGPVDIGFRLWNPDIIATPGQTDSTSDLATSYHIGGFSNHPGDAASQSRIESDGPLTLTGLSSNGTNLLASGSLLSINASVDIMDPDSQLTVTTNGDITIRDGVDLELTYQSVDESFAEALLNTAIRNESMIPITDSAVDYVVNQVIPPDDNLWNETILAQNPAGFWRFSESSGLTAANGLVKQSTSDIVLGQNPDGFWRFNESSSSLAVTNSVAKSPSGTYANVSVQQPGADPNDPADTAVSFAGQAPKSYVRIPDSDSLYGADGQTVTGWFYIDAFDKEWQSIYWKGDTPDCTAGCGNRENTLFINRGGYVWFTGAPTGRGSEIVARSADGTVQTGHWYHFATILDPQQNQMRVFLNGNEVASTSFAETTVQDTAGDWYLGNNPSWDSQLNGKLDQFAIFNRILTEDEIRQQVTVTSPDGSYVSVDLGVLGANVNDSADTAVSFVGRSNAYVTIPDSDALYGAYGQTVTGWFYIDSFDKDWQTIYWKGDTPDCTDGCANRENSLWIYKTGLMHLAAAPTGSTGQSSISSPAGKVLAGQWNHFATILDPQQDTMRVYLNGEKLIEGGFPATTLQNTAGDWHLGNNPTWNSQLNGQLDQFAIFNRILSDDEIRQQFDTNKDPGQATVWLPATDVRKEGTWTWLLGDVEREMFFEGDYRSAVLSAGFVENWDTAQPDNQNSQQHYLAVQANGTWQDVDPDGKHSYVLETRDGFQLIEGSYSFADAWLDALSRGGSMATAQTQPQWNEIQDVLGGKEAWLAGTDAADEGYWEWLTPVYREDVFRINGLELQRDTLWNKGEPNNVIHSGDDSGRGEDFLERRYDGLWNDIPTSISGNPVTHSYVTSQRHERRYGDVTRIQSLTSTAGNITLDAAEDVLISGEIRTAPMGTFTWGSNSRLLADGPDLSIVRVVSDAILLEGQGGLGASDAEPLTVQTSHISHSNPGLSSTGLYVDNTNDSLEIGDLSVDTGNLLIVAAKGLKVTGPVAVTSGGNLSLIANGLPHTTVEDAAVQLFRSEVLFWQENIELGFSNWNGGEPNNYNGNENHASMYSNGRWNDADGETRLGGYILERNGEYQFVGGSFNWWEAQHDAQTKGGRLAIIQNQTDQLIAEQHTGGTTVWIGATDAGHEDSWTWITQSGYWNFAINQPDNYRGDEHFLQMWPDGTWNDAAHNTRLNGYLLKKDGNFSLVTGSFDWSEAASDAIARGGQLATIRNSAEQTLAAAAAAGQSVWLGGTDFYTEGDWNWVQRAGLVIDAPVITSGGDGNINLVGRSGIELGDSNPALRYEWSFWPLSTGFSNWNNGEPNNYNGNENQLSMYSNGRWNDANGATRLGGYILQFNGSYQLVRGDFNWHEAAYDAQSRGGQLATIENESQQIAAQKLTEGLTVWLGGTDDGHEGQWKWVQTPAHANWNTGEPNNFIHSGDTSGQGEDFLFMKGNGLWNDASGSTRTNYLLEKEGIYRLVTGSFTWVEANADAISQGGHLAVILTREDQIHAEAAANGNNVWLGATDQARESYWNWISTPIQDARTLVSSSGHGQIVIAAGTEYVNDELKQGDPAAQFIMQPRTRVASDHGNIIVMSASEVILSEITTTEDAQANGGNVLVVADYDGVLGTMPDQQGIIIPQPGTSIHVDATRVIFAAEGRNDDSGFGIGTRSSPIETRVTSLAAISDYGDIAINNEGDLVIERIDIPLRGILSEVFDSRSVISMEHLPEKLSDLDNSDATTDAEIGVFSMAGLGILNRNNPADRRYAIEVNSTSSLTVVPDIPVVNLAAGPLQLSALSPDAPPTLFEFVEGAFTWEQARLDAVSRGGRLANITNLQTQRHLENRSTNDYWIGASDAASEGTWYWLVDDRYIKLAEYGFTNWNTGEPNDFNNNEDYGQFYAATGNWNDNSGSATMGYILEFPPETTVSVQSRMFSEGGLNEIRLLNGYEDLPIRVPLPAETCQLYHSLDAAGEFTVGSTIQLSLSQCPDDDPQAPLSVGTHSGSHDEVRLFHSFTSDERDAATYEDGEPLGTLEFETPESGETTVYLRLLYHDGTYTDYQKTFEIADDPASNLMVMISDAFLPVGQFTTLTGSFQEPSGTDFHTVVVNWQDGTPPDVVVLQPGELSFQLEHAFQHPGRLEPLVTITDIETGHFLSETLVALIGGIHVNDGILHVVGSEVNDIVSITETGRRVLVKHSIQGEDSRRTRIARKWFSSIDLDGIGVYTVDGQDRVHARTRLATTIDGGPGNDRLVATRGNATVIDLSGSNRVIVTGTQNSVMTGDGADRITARGGATTIIDAGGNNRVRTGIRDDTIHTGDGHDWIRDRGGNNSIRSTGGNNRIRTRSGHDEIHSGPGDDRIRAGRGDNTVVDTGGANLIVTRSGDDHITVTEGDNTIRPGSGNNSITTIVAPLSAGQSTGLSSTASTSVSSVLTSPSETSPSGLVSSDTLEPPRNRARDLVFRQVSFANTQPRFVNRPLSAEHQIHWYPVETAVAYEILIRTVDGTRVQQILANDLPAWKPVPEDAIDDVDSLRVRAINEWGIASEWSDRLRVDDIRLQNDRNRSTQLFESILDELLLLNGDLSND